jgi:mono/diheme cytochrome c family protein
MALRTILLAMMLALQAVPPAAAETFTPAEERQEDYPEAPGREQAFYACIACHGFKIVAQQGQTRQQWDDTLNWMTKRHGMPPIDGDLRKTVLDYLETAFPPRTAPGGWKNPFSGQ